MYYNYIIALTSSSSNTPTPITIAIGGAVGGAVLLVLSLCTVVWCVCCHKRKKTVCSNQPSFKLSLRIHASNPHYIYEIENTEATTRVEARMCK